MFSARRTVIRPVLAALTWGLLAAGAFADSPQDRFQRAYFLENHDSDYAAAEKLYAEVANEKGADAALRADAKRRRDACREEAVAADFARLMPAGAWAYAEVSRPGDQILRLLDQLGLVRGDEKPTQKVAERFAISPELVQDLLGVRGVAACLTGFDMSHQMPMGVAVIHPGKLGVIRAALETALPVQFTPSESIEGYDTYHIEGQVFVTLTSRLIVVSPQRAEIEGVVRRLKGEDDDTLASNPDVAELLKSRGDNLLLAFANFKPMMPLIQTGLAAAAAQEREMAAAGALLDVKSLRSLTAKLGVAKDGLFLEVGLDLDEGHRNLVLDFLNLPSIDSRTLKLVPNGAAAFAAMALNEPDTKAQKIEGTSEPSRRKRISALDIGRELFHNIVGICAFVLPSTSKIGNEPEPIPDFALVMTTRDVAKSEALWAQMLGIAGMASGAAPGIDGSTVEIEGAKVRRFALPEGFAVLMAVSGDAIVISPSQAAIGKALAAQRGGKSVLDDAEFSRAVATITPDTSLAVFGHAGRCLEIGKNYMSQREREEIGQYGDLLNKTVAGLLLEQGDHNLRIAARVSGIPNVSGVVAQLIREQRDGGARREVARQAMRRGDTKGALAAIDEEMSKQEDDEPQGRLLLQKFEILASKPGDAGAAVEIGEQLLGAWAEDANELNSMAWKLLTDGKFEGRFSELARRMSERSNALTGHSNWMYLDTLAHARFALGDVEAAIELERRALENCKDNRRGEAEKALKRFEEARSKQGVSETN